MKEKVIAQFFILLTHDTREATQKCYILEALDFQIKLVRAKGIET